MDPSPAKQARKALGVVAVNAAIYGAVRLGVPLSTEDIVQIDLVCAAVAVYYLRNG
jgi:hypothetical protein